MTDLLESATHESMISWLVNALAEIIETSPEDIDIHEDMSNYALDSVSALRMVGNLEMALDQPIDPMILREYTTVDSLAKYLSEISE